MARFTPRTTEREMRSAWWDIEDREYLVFLLSSFVVAYKLRIFFLKPRCKSPSAKRAPTKVSATRTICTIGGGGSRARGAVCFPLRGEAECAATRVSAGTLRVPSSRGAAVPRGPSRVTVVWAMRPSLSRSGAARGAGLGRVPLTVRRTCHVMSEAMNPVSVTSGAARGAGLGRYPTVRVMSCPRP